MTFANYLPKIQFHPLLLIFVLIALITGLFLELMVIIAIVCIHEMGHFFMAKKFNWRVTTITLWIFGGVMKTEEHGNRPLMEEALVTVSGPFQHVLIFLVVKLLQIGNILPLTITELIIFYNQMIFFFNLLPVWPLDGGKLFWIVLSNYLPFRKSYNTTIFLSMIFCFLLIPIHFFLFSFQLSAILLFVFLFLENQTEWKQKYYVFIRFLLNRYEEERTYRKTHPLIIPYHASLMDVFSHFYREKEHPIYIDFPGQIRYKIDEKDCLHCYFSDKKYRETVGQLFEGIS